MDTFLKRKLKFLSANVCSNISPRASVIKLKINGVCVNKCVFCTFNRDPSLLDVHDISYFFDMVDKPNYRWIVVNGGEPTIHPRFLDICSFLKDRFKDRTLISLGTNLIPLSWRFEKYSRIYTAILDTFDRIEVGCDDEHRNIDLVESFAPGIVEAGLVLWVNVVAPFCSDRTKSRILALRERLGINVTFSEVHHFIDNNDHVASKRSTAPCRHRSRHLLLNCNGDVFFCFHHEMERPLFNLHAVSRQDLNYYLNQHPVPSYQYCAICPLYSPEGLLHSIA